MAAAVQLRWLFVSGESVKAELESTWKGVVEMQKKNLSGLHSRGCEKVKINPILKGMEVRLANQNSYKALGQLLTGIFNFL